MQAFRERLAAMAQQVYELCTGLVWGTLQPCRTQSRSLSAVAVLECPIAAISLLVAHLAAEGYTTDHGIACRGGCTTDQQCADISQGDPTQILLG